MQLFGNRKRRYLVVARYHNYAYARLMAGFNGAYNLLSGRIYHADGAHERHVEFDIVRLVLGHLYKLSLGKTEDAQRVFGHVVAQIEYFAPVNVSHLPNAVAREIVRTKRQHFINGPFGICDKPFRHLI